jgi:hypothetical protein
MRDWWTATTLARVLSNLQPAGKVDVEPRVAHATGNPKISQQFRAAKLDRISGGCISFPSRPTFSIRPVVYLQPEAYPLPRSDQHAISEEAMAGKRSAPKAEPTRRSKRIRRSSPAPQVSYCCPTLILPSLESQTLPLAEWRAGDSTITFPIPSTARRATKQDIPVGHGHG